MEWDGEERRKHRELTDEEVSRIAGRVFDLVYIQVGKNAFRLVLWVIGAGCLVVLAWLTKSGYLKP